METLDITVADSRKLGRARGLVARAEITHLAGQPDDYTVTSESNPTHHYTVHNADRPTCTCPDPNYPCKHIIAVRIYLAARARIEKFCSARGWDEQRLASELARLSSFGTAGERHRIYIGAIAIAAKPPAQPTTPTIRRPHEIVVGDKTDSQNKAASFFVRFWWPGNDGTAPDVLDPDTLNIRPPDPPAWEIRTRAETHYRPPNNPNLDQLRDYITNNNLTIIDAARVAWDTHTQQALWRFAIGNPERN